MEQIQIAATFYTLSNYEFWDRFYNRIFVNRGHQFDRNH